jgi:DNA-binding transcriptional LysR family regulator
MTITCVETFLAIVSTRSISNAAKLLFLSQSTVSLHLKALEEELGFMLIERQKGLRYIELTPKGKEFVSIAERFVQLDKDAKAIKLANKLNLTIGSVDSYNGFVFGDFYRQIFFGPSQMNIEIFTQHSPEIYDQLDKHLIDVGLVPRKMYRQNIIIKPIFSEKIFIVRRSDDLITSDKYEKIHPKDLKFEKEVLFKSDPEFMQWHDSWCNPNYYPQVRIDTITLLLNFLKNEYWSMLPASIIKVLQRSCPLTIMDIADGPPDKICYLVTHKYPMRTRTDAIKMFEERLLNYLKENKDSLQVTLL